MRFLAPLLALAFLLPPGLAAQGGAGVVEGTVVSPTGVTLGTVRVAVLSAADSSVAGAQTTGTNGRFRITGLRPGRYRVAATLVGFNPYTGPVVTITAASPTVDAGTIRLTAAAIALQGLQVTAEKSAVIVAPDRTIYSTSDMPVAAGGMATDVLRSVPELEVDINGGVQLKGTAPQIYINGRPSPITGEALDQFLQQFPADRIERIEVIASPGARFEAEGAGGIVNIVLKKNVSLGMSGNVYANGGTRGDLGTGARLTYQSGPLTLFSGGFVRISNRDDSSFDERQNLLADPVTFFRQEESSERDGTSGNLDLSAELRTSEKGTLWAEASGYRNGSDATSLSAYTIMDAVKNPTSRYNRPSTREQTHLSTELGLGYRHVFEERKHELEFQLRLEGDGEDRDSRIREQILTLEGEDAGLPQELTTDITDENRGEKSLRADYTRPFLGDEGRLEVGYRGEISDTDNGRVQEIFPSLDATEPTSSTDVGFGFREIFNSGYASLSRALGPLRLQGGVRTEFSRTRLDLPNDGGTFERSYTSVFPNAHVNYDFGSGRELRLSYSRRIRRPGAWILDPTDRSTDPLNRRVGNPDIDPQYTESVNLEASWSGQVGTLRLSPYYRHTTDDWAQIKEVDEAGVSTVTWENLASVDAYGSSFTASLRPIGMVNGSVSLSAFREERNASNLALDVSGASMRYSAHGNLMARLNPALSAQAMLYYTPAHDVAQGRVSSTFMMNFGLRQQLWGKKATLNLMTTDPFDLYRSKFVTHDPTHVQVGRSRFSARRAVLTLSYSFGRPPKSQRQSEQPEEQGPPATEIR
jgi:outer membrane receptor protein involved in Fe transport